MIQSQSNLQLVPGFPQDVQTVIAQPPLNSAGKPSAAGLGARAIWICTDTNGEGTASCREAGSFNIGFDPSVGQWKVFTHFDVAPALPPAAAMGKTCTLVLQVYTL